MTNATRVTIKVAAVRKFIKKALKPAEYKSLVQVLNKSLVNYEKETDPIKRNHLKDSILRNYETLRKNL